MLETFSILKARWQEVLLIVGLQGVAQYAIMHMTGTDEKTITSDTVALTAMIYSFGFVVVKLLSLGFARTSFTDGPMQWNPWPLMKIGHHFFWRVVGFEILVYSIIILLSIPLALVAKAVFYSQAEVSQELMMKLVPICMGPAMLVMARPFIFGPANILVTNAGIGEAYSYLRYFSMRRHGKLLAVYTAWIILYALPSTLMAYGTQRVASIAALPCVLAITLLSIVLYVGAVKGAAKVYLTMQDDAARAESKATDTVEEDKI
jgi:hypothetical protein